MPPPPHLKKSPNASNKAGVKKNTGPRIFLYSVAINKCAAVHRFHEGKFFFSLSAYSGLSCFSFFPPRREKEFHIIHAATHTAADCYTHEEPKENSLSTHCCTLEPRRTAREWVHPPHLSVFLYFFFTPSSPRLSLSFYMRNVYSFIFSLDNKWSARKASFLSHFNFKLIGVHLTWITTRKLNWIVNFFYSNISSYFQWTFNPPPCLGLPVLFAFCFIWNFNGGI